MKFRTIFIIFNIAILFAFLFVFFIPFFLFSFNESVTFWLQNWPFVIFFIAIITTFNLYFIKNWKIYTYLEHEQWEQLAELLKQQIYERHNFSKRVIRLYINSALLSNNVQAVIELEEYLKEKKPSVLEKNRIYFIVTRVLTNNYTAAAQLLEGITHDATGEFNDWLVFYKGFVPIMQKDYSQAVEPLRKLLKAKDPVIKLLALYLLQNICLSAIVDENEKVAVQQEVTVMTGLLKNHLTPKRWSMETERAKNEIPAVIIASLIDEAGKWMFQTT